MKLSPDAKRDIKELADACGGMASIYAQNVAYLYHCALGAAMTERSDGRDQIIYKAIDAVRDDLVRRFRSAYATTNSLDALRAFTQCSDGQMSPTIPALDAALEELLQDARKQVEAAKGEST